MSRLGPFVVLKCNGCDFYEQVRYSCQGDSGYDKYCCHPNFKPSREMDEQGPTPDWCPLRGTALHTALDALAPGGICTIGQRGGFRRPVGGMIRHSESCATGARAELRGECDCGGIALPYRARLLDQLDGHGRRLVEIQVDGPLTTTDATYLGIVIQELTKEEGQRWSNRKKKP
jgi:hypothetical protein